MFQRSMLTDSDVAELASAALDVLETVGILCQNDELLAALADWGAIVEPGDQIARFPKHLVEAFSSSLREEGQAKWGGAAGWPGATGPAGHWHPGGAVLPRRCDG